MKLLPKTCFPTRSPTTVAEMQLQTAFHRAVDSVVPLSDVLCTYVGFFWPDTSFVFKLSSFLKFFKVKVKT